MKKLTTEYLIELMTKPVSQFASERLVVCRQCEHYNRWGICNKCGCVLAVKARIPGMKCPIGKW